MLTFIKKQMIILIILFTAMNMLIMDIGLRPSEYHVNAASPIFVINTDNIPTAKASEQISFQLKVQNASSIDATNVQIYFSLPADSPFESTSLVNSQLYPTFQANTVQAISLNFRVKSSASVGVHPMLIKFIYNDNTGERFERNDSIYIRVIENTDVIHVDVASTATIPAVVTIGKPFQLTLDIANKSTRQVNNVEVSLVNLSKDTFASLETNKKTTDILVPAQRKTLNFRLSSSGKLESGNQPIDLILKYSNGLGELIEEKRTIYIQVVKESFSSIRISNMNIPQSPVAMGRNFEVSFDLENTTYRVLENVTVSVDGGDQILPVSSKIKMIEQMNVSSKQNISFILQPLEKITPKLYVLQLEVKYPVALGSNEYTIFKETFTVEVVKGTELQIINPVFPEKIREEQAFDFRFELANIGKGLAKNVKASVELVNGIISNSETYIFLDNIESESNKTVNFKLRSTKIEQSGIYPIVINLTSDSFQDVNSYKYAVFIEKAEKKTGTPRIILEKYTINPNNIKPGGTFDLELQLMNTSSVKTVNNIKVSLSSDEFSDNNVTKGSVFTPVDASNTYFISKLSPNESKSNTITYLVKSNVDAKNYNVSMTIEYEDLEGNAFNVKEIISIPIQFNAQYYATDLFLPSEVAVGEEARVSIRFFNTGKVPMKKFQLIPEGDFILDSLPYYAIKLDPGAEDFYEFVIIPQKEGEINGKLQLSYEDTNGEMVTSEKNFLLNAVNLSINSSEIDIGLETDDSIVSIFSPINLAIFLLIFGVAILIRILYLKKKKRDNL